ncbi:hypothetical protein [Allokutzneria oryzae]|uniref:Universal stress protein n=1 Tax=Allokutzneria oryzae TaxID=1378989 RepID=A0ABV6A3A2_9PSEU
MSLHAPLATAVPAPAPPRAAGRVLVGTDGSYWGEAALEWAARIAWTGGAELEVLGTGEASQYRAPRAFPRLAVTTRRTSERPLTDVLRSSEDARLLVLGCRGHRHHGFGLGRLVVPAIASARCDTVIVRGRPDAVQGRHGRITAMVDGGPHDPAVLRGAVEFARLFRAEIEVVHAWPAPSPSTPDIVLDLAAVQLADLDTRRPFSLRLDTRVPHESVPRISDSDLIVVGPGTPPGQGGVITSALHHAACPVLVAHTDTPDRSPDRPAGRHRAEHCPQQTGR